MAGALVAVMSLAPMRGPRVGRVASLALAISAPALLWYSAVGNPLDYLDPSVPDGQLLYVLSKLAGLCAVALLALQLTATLLRGTRIGRAFAHRSVRAHVWFGTAVLLMSALHVSAFVTAASVRSGHFAGHLLLPRLSSGFDDAMVSIGAHAFTALLVAAVLGSLARRGARGTGASGERAVRQRLRSRAIHHVLMLGLVPLVLVHSYAIGSETDTLPGLAFYGVAGGVLAIGVGRGIRRAVNAAATRVGRSDVARAKR